jgi:uncharacterized protein (UPF0264 family)
MEPAISLKQPWAALVVHGLKTVEVRRWSTARRGRVLIHAARVPDQRPQAWKHVTPAVEATARLTGGIIGEAHLLDCEAYTSREQFARRRVAHLNDPNWFVAPRLYGFVLEQPRLLPFRRWPGALYFFDVPAAQASTVEEATGLLVSVRSVTEARAALHGGAEIIDIKEPARGSLGGADAKTIKAVIKAVNGTRAVSAALGELTELREPEVVPGLAFVKCGLAGLRRGWARKLEALRETVAQRSGAPEVVTVAYADWQAAAAPPWREVADHALARPGGVLLLDTFDKAPRLTARTPQPASLLDWIPLDELTTLADQCRAAGVRLALAGSLGVRQIARLCEARPRWFAVRGAVCEADRRDGAVHVLKVRALAALVAGPPAEPPAQPAAVATSGS